MMFKANLVRGQLKRYERMIKRTGEITRDGAINQVKFGAKAGVKKMISMTGKPIRKKTRYIWADTPAAKFRGDVIKLKDSIPTPGAGFGRSGWARGAQKLYISKAAEYGYGPGSAMVRLRRGQDPYVSITNSVSWVSDMDAGRPVPGIPDARSLYRRKHVHLKSRGLVADGVKVAEQKFNKEMDRMIRKLKSNWRL